MPGDMSERQGAVNDPIIMLHGWGMNASVFETLGNALSGISQVECIDLPGYGGSRWKAGLSFEDQAANLARQLPGGSLLGWSMGGLYATEMVRQKPQQFSQLILVGSTPCFVRREGWHCAVEESVLDSFADYLDNGWSTTIRRFIALQMLGEVDASRLGRELWAKIQAAAEPDVGALRYGLELLKTCDMRSVLSGLDLPIKMIFGERDALVPAVLAKEIIEVNPKIQVELMADVGHAPLLSRPDQLVSLILGLPAPESAGLDCRQGSSD